MSEAWPAVCVLLALVGLLLLVIRWRFPAFLALLLVSLGLGLAAGLPPLQVLQEMARGIGDILRDVAIVLVLGAMLGRALEASGAADVIAQTLLRCLGEKHASLALLLAAYLIGIPVLFNVGFLLLVPIAWRLQQQTGKSLLWYVLPLGFSLATTHSLIPPHPGIVAAVTTLGADMIQTMLFGTLMGLPVVLVGWFGPGRLWAKRHVVTPPPHLALSVANQQPPVNPARQVPFSLAIALVVLPLLLCLFGFGMKLLADWQRLPAWSLEGGDYSPVAWAQFVGQPSMALLVATGCAFAVIGLYQGKDRHELSKLGEKAINDVGGMALLFGAAGALKQVIVATGAGAYVAGLLLQMPLSPVLTAFLVAALARIALGSATAAIVTASALLVGFAESLPGQATLLTLAVANGVTCFTQPADTGFWLVKEYGNLSVQQVLVGYNACRMTMAVTGLALLLAWEAFIQA